MAPRFLSLAHLLRIHQESIDTYGGSPGLRDRGLLESAIGQPRAQLAGQYLHEDLPAMAAAYLYHIVSNHPFVDGNKRTGAMAAYVFLEINDFEMTATQSELADFVLRIADGSASKEEAIQFMRRNTRPK